MTTNQTWQPMESDQRLLDDLARVRAQFQLYTVLEAMGVKYERDSKWLDKSCKDGVKSGHD